MLQRIAALNRTRDETQAESLPGCLLTQNLTRQIQRRLSQLDSSQEPSRDFSVIRCASTPDNTFHLDRENFSFGDIEDIPEDPFPQLPPTPNTSITTTKNI